MTQPTGHDRPVIMDHLYGGPEAADNRLTTRHVPGTPPPWPPWADRFLLAYSDSHNEAAACKFSGINRRIYKNAVHTNPDFVTALQDAHRDYICALEALLGTLAFKKHDFKAIIKLLERHDPENWTPVRRLEQTGAGGGAIILATRSDEAMHAELMRRLLPAGYDPDTDPDIDPLEGLSDADLAPFETDDEE